MLVHQLKYQAATERDLQDVVFADWQKAKREYLVAGAPAWLWRVGPTSNARQRFEPGAGAPFEPDLLWLVPEATYLIELKSAAKAEPLALPQVLYYAWMLERDERVRASLAAPLPIIPALITQPNAWTRGAIDYLRHKGFTVRSTTWSLSVRR